MRKGFLCLLVFLSQVLSAQVELLEFHNLDYSDGLCNDHINSISEDKNGYLWFATQNGLEIYDGSLLETLKQSNSDSASISSNDIATVYSSKEGFIYAGTWGKGVNKINPTTREVKRLPLSKEPNKNYVKSIVKDNHKHLWLGSFGGGVYLLKNGDTQYTEIKVEGQSTLKGKFNFIQQLIEFDDKIWVISWKDGFGYINPEENILRDVKDQNGNLFVPQNLSFIISFRNKLLLSTTWGDLYSFDTKTNKFSLLHSFKESQEHRNRITTLCPVDEESLWVSTESGLYKYNVVTDQTIKVNAGVNNKKYDQNLCSHKDSRGIVWFGTSGKGVNRYDSRYHKLKKIRLSEVNPVNVNTVYPLSPQLIMLGTNKGIVLFDAVNKTSNKLICKGGQAKNVSENEITYISSFNERFLIGTTNGLFSMSKNFDCEILEVTDQKFFEASAINDITHIRNQVWVSSQDNGILILDTNKESYSEHYSTRHHASSNLKYDESYCIFEYDDNHILVGAQEGIEVYDQKKGVFEILTINDTLSSSIMSKVKAISRDYTGNLWIGSNEGLWKTNESFSTLQKFNLNARFANPSVQSLLLVDSTLWVTTISGMCSIDLKNENVEYFTTKHGLISNSFPHGGSYLSGDSIIYFGNGNGIALLHLDDDERFEPKVRLKIRNLFINDEEYYFKDTLNNTGKDQNIVLNYDENNLSIHLSAIDFSIHYNDMYAYKLKGFDRNWHYKTYNQSIIDYTNIPPGKYQLITTAVDNHHHRIGDEKILNITIESPFWTKTWFRLLVTVFIVFFIIVLWKLRLAKIKRQKMRLQMKVDIRTEELNKEQEKLKKTNISLSKTLDELHEQQALIKSNIDYAAVIQESFLPSLNDIKKCFDDAFVLYKPKDVVSGDFYWYAKINNKSIFIVADCTGHGVSGALMSVYTNSLLNLIIRERKILDPNLILDELHRQLIKSFKNSSNKIDDGLDLTVLSYDQDSSKIELAGAMTKATIIQDGQHVNFNGDRFPLGGSGISYNKRTHYKKQKFSPIKNTIVFLYSDGFQDQFHHETDKKMMRKTFVESLVKHHKEPLSQQHKHLEELLNSWKGNKQQTDDVLVVGVKFD